MRTNHEFFLDLPVRLYFDLEYYLEFNEDKNGSIVLNKLIDDVIVELKVKYDVSCSSADVLVLDSCSKKKFSYHLIFPSVVFENNIQCKEFVKSFVESNSDERKQNIVNGPNDSKKSIIDLSVYSKNQNLRIIFSSKYGKDTRLLLSEENKFPVNSTNSGQYQLFLDSLVSDKSLLVNVSSTDILKPCEDTSVRIDTFDVNDTSVPSNLKVLVSEISMGLIPMIANGKIRKVKFFENRGTSASVLIFELSNFGFCLNINREHKRNNVYFVFNLKSRLLFQKCMKCVGFTSPAIPLNL